MNRLAFRNDARQSVADGLATAATFENWAMVHRRIEKGEKTKLSSAIEELIYLASIEKLDLPSFMVK